MTLPTTNCVALVARSDKLYSVPKTLIIHSQIFEVINLRFSSP